MIAAVVQFIKEQKYFIFTFLISLAVASFGYYVHITNHSLTVHLQSAESKVQQLIDEKTQLTNSFTEQLQSSESINQRLLDEKKELKNEIDQNLQLATENMQKLLEEKKEFEKKISQLTAKLQSSKDSNQRLLEEKQEFQNKIDQSNAKFQSVMSENQKLLEDKIKVLEKIDQINEDQIIYNIQIQLTDKCMNLIDEVEKHIRAVIHCSESRRRSLYANPMLCSKIGYDLDESYAGEIILRVIDLIMKYKDVCTKFMDALLLRRIEEMKKQQDEYDMEKLKEKMKKLLEEVRYTPNHRQSKEKDVEREGILSMLYKFGKWAFKTIAGVFWS